MGATATRQSRSRALAAWRTRLRKSACPICKDGPLDVIAELEVVWVTAPRVAPLPGYACVVAKTHVIEPFDLDPRESSAFWRDAMIAAKAVAGVFRPIKMNYDIHGNTIPHLHLHLYPRFQDDPYANGPIDNRAQFERTSADLNRLARAVIRQRGKTLR